jgi:hypothetical protein
VVLPRLLVANSDKAETLSSRRADASIGTSAEGRLDLEVEDWPPQVRENVLEVLTDQVTFVAPRASVDSDDHRVAVHLQPGEEIATVALDRVEKGKAIVTEIEDQKPIPAPCADGKPLGVVHPLVGDLDRARPAKRIVRAPLDLPETGKATRRLRLGGDLVDHGGEDGFQELRQRRGESIVEGRGDHRVAGIDLVGSPHTCDLSLAARGKPQDQRPEETGGVDLTPTFHETCLPSHLGKLPVTDEVFQVRPNPDRLLAGHSSLLSMVAFLEGDHEV